jgi:hypothetical protein
VRGVLRIASLSILQDCSYGTGLELLAFDDEGLQVYRLEAPYGKLLPIQLDSGTKLLLMLRALDRVDGKKTHDPVWTGTGTNTSDTNTSNGALVILDLSYEDFLLLSRTNQGMDLLVMGDLFAAKNRLGQYGYMPEIFGAEILYRISAPGVFLPMMILVLIIGWRYRARRHLRYVGIPMLVVLPLVFNGFVLFYQTMLKALSVDAVLSLGFSTAIVIFIVGTLVFFIVTLVILAGQRS